MAIGQATAHKIIKGIGLAAAVIFIVTVGHFGSYLGIALTIGSFVVFIACLILAHLLGSDEDAGFWPNNP